MIHNDYLEEKERLDYTVSEVTKALSRSRSGNEGLSGTMETLRKKRNGDNSQAFVEMMVSSMLLERNDTRLKNLKKARKKPYFCRVDFTEENGQEEVYYIGKTGLLREEDQDLVIMDWRAPASNLYYDSRIGKASYNSPCGEISGEVTLKRQIIVENGEIEEIRDIDVTVSDDFLQKSLSMTSEGRLKEIVATIQEEQNQVIRAEMYTPLIVQGAAGSGKTTIALHRIAWLIYHNEETMKPENFMILAPNKFFLDYISEILPELGTDEAKQTTFKDFAVSMLGKVKVAEHGDRLRQLAVGVIDLDLWQKNSRIAGFKGSLEFKEILDRYVKHLEERIFPNKSLSIGTHNIMTREAAMELLYGVYSNLPLEKRLIEITKHFKSRGDRLVLRLKNNAEKMSTERIKKLKASGMDDKERQVLAYRVYENRDSLLKQVDEAYKVGLNEYISWGKGKNALAFYKDLFVSENFFFEMAKDGVENNISDKDLKELYIETKRVLDTGKVDYEDLAPLLYLNNKITGVSEKTEVKHVVVDEAQDFSLLQLLTLKTAIKDSSFTVLGDLAQGIHGYRSVSGWDELNNEVFAGKAETLELIKCYRNTVEIMDASIKYHETGDNRISKPEAVLRHGEAVKYFRNAGTDMINDVEDLILKWVDKKYGSIAIVTATDKVSTDISRLLKKRGIDTKLITEKDGSFIKGVVCIAANLVKGLEFDCVIFVDKGFEVYGDELLEKRLKYISCTRALHELAIFTDN